MHFNRQFLIISDQNSLPSLERSFVSSFGRNAVKTFELPTLFFEKNFVGNWYQLKQYFNQIARCLNEYPSVSNLRNLVVFIHAWTTFPAPDNKWWNPCYFKEFDKKDSDKMESGQGEYHREMLFSWLILAFPEVRFVFYAESDADGKQQPFDISKRLHFMTFDESPINYFEKTDFPVLFDPSGIRDTIRSYINPPRPRHPGIWRRNKIAVVIEDEMDFSHFYGYTAYRFGCKTWMIHNMRQANSLLKSEDHGISFAISLEDLRLGFSDKDNNTHLSTIDERSTKLPISDSIKNRFIVTYGKVSAPHNQITESGYPVYSS